MKLSCLYDMHTAASRLLAYLKVRGMPEAFLNMKGEA